MTRSIRWWKHESAIVDEGATIDEGTKIWHFSHVCSGAVIGNACSLGQNVFVGNQVVIGNNCKIQNNVSVYDNVTLEDDVFCGPSMVFTNRLNKKVKVLCTEVLTGTKPQFVNSDFISSAVCWHNLSMFIF